MYRDPCEFSIIEFKIFIELRAGPPLNVLEIKRELTWTDGVWIIPATILPVEICDTFRVDVYRLPVLRTAPGLKAFNEPDAVILDVIRVDAVRVFNEKLFDNKSVFVLILLVVKLPAEF